MILEIIKNTFIIKCIPHTSVTTLWPYLQCSPDIFGNIVRLMLDWCFANVVKQHNLVTQITMFCTFVLITLCHWFFANVVQKCCIDILQHNLWPKSKCSTDVLATLWNYVPLTFCQCCEIMFYWCFANVVKQHKFVTQITIFYWCLGNVLKQQLYPNIGLTLWVCLVYPANKQC